MSKDDEVFEQLSALSDIQMDPDKKRTLRDDLHRRMGRESRKRSLGQRLRSLAPIGVGAAAVVVAGAGIASIMMHKHNGHLTSSTALPSVTSTSGAGVAASAALEPTNLWFIITMLSLVAGMVIVFLTRRLESPWEWPRDTLAIIRSPMTWGAAFGIAIGIRGIPVPDGYSAWWVWYMPGGSYVASATILGTFGTLVGGIIHFTVKKHLSWQATNWWLGFTAFALLAGIIGFYRVHDGEFDAATTLETQGLSWAMIAGRDSTSVKDTPAQTHTLGEELIRAGADIGAAGDFLSRHGIPEKEAGNVNQVADGLSGAGNQLIQVNSLQDAPVASQFIKQAAMIIERERGHNGFRNQDMPQMFSELSSIVPNTSAYNSGLSN